MPRAAPNASKKSPPAVPRSRRVVAPRSVDVGDVLKIERRYVVDGALTSVTDQGSFKGIQLLGSTEHLVLEDGENKNVRMIPLYSISEITLLSSSPRADRGEFDPSFA